MLATTGPDHPAVSFNASVSHDHSYILNVGSLASFFLFAQKASIWRYEIFYLFLHQKFKKRGRKSNVHVSVLCPGGMNTNLALTLMNKTGNCLSRLSVMNPEEVVPIAIDGLLRGKEVIIPGKLNKFFMLLDKVLPELIKKIITNHGMKRLNPANPLSRYTAPVLAPVALPTSSG